MKDIQIYIYKYTLIFSNKNLLFNIYDAIKTWYETNILLSIQKQTTLLYS